MKRKDYVLISGVGLLILSGIAGVFKLSPLMDMTLISAIVLLIYRAFGDFEN